MYIIYRNEKVSSSDGDYYSFSGFFCGYLFSLSLLSPTNSTIIHKKFSYCFFLSSSTAQQLLYRFEFSFFSHSSSLTLEVAVFNHVDGHKTYRMPCSHSSRIGIHAVGRRKLFQCQLARMKCSRVSSTRFGNNPSSNLYIPL